MSADGFEVDYIALGNLAQQLANLRGEFEKGEDAVAPLLGTISDQELRQKISEFAKNWSDRKEILVKKLDEVAGFAKAAADAYREVDQEGAKALACPVATPGKRP